MTTSRIAVIGGGIVGAAVTRELVRMRPDAEVTLLEKEERLAAHQTGRNSGVVHAGLYYTPGSLKAELCRRGVGMLHDFCAEHDVRYDECGKLLVALDPVERERLADIAERAAANGVPGVRAVGPAEMRDIEPHVTGIAGLYSPTTAIVDFPEVTRRLAAVAAEQGAAVRTGCAVTTLDDRAREVVVGGSGFSAGYDLAIVCAGLHADRLARLAGDGSDPRIVPFRGEYHLLKPARRDLVRGLVYPVPDPRYPFLGVHITPRVDGEVLIGPNAVLALAREGYRRRDLRLSDLREIFGWPGFRRFALRHWRTGAAEVAGSLSRRVFIARARRYVPALTVDDVVPGPSGIRAQALGADGTLVDDFRITRNGRVVCVRNAPSPAATSALAIAEHIVRKALDNH